MCSQSDCHQITKEFKESRIAELREIPLLPVIGAPKNRNIFFLSKGIQREVVIVTVENIIRNDNIPCKQKKVCK